MSGFAAFVQGFQGGVDTRHRWADRRRNIEREKVADGYEADRQERIGEEHGWNRDRHGVFMDESGDADRIREQQWGDFSSERAALEAATAAADAGMIQPTMPAMGAGGPVEKAASSMSIPPEARTTGRGSSVLMPPMGAQGDYTIQKDTAPGQIGPGPGGAVVGPQTAPKPTDDPLLAENEDGSFTPLRAPRDEREKFALAEAAKAGVLKPGDAAASRQSQIDAAGNARLTENPVAAGLRRDENHQWGMPAGAGADIKEAAKLPVRGAIATVDAAVNQGLKGVRQINRVANPIAKWISGKDFGEPSDVDSLNRNAPAFPDPVKAKQDEVAAGAAKVAEAVTSTPAGQAAANALPELGVKPGQSLNAAQIKKGAETWMQSYRDNGLPIVTKELMRQGRFTEAETMRTFVNDATAQEGMKAWSGAVFSAMSGDLDTAASLMIDAYNANGYFDDGYQIDKAETELIKADDGEVMGVRLALINQQTGEKIVQESEISDLIEKGLWLLSPEKAAEQYLARQEAMTKHLMELDADRRAAQADVIKTEAAQADKNAIELMKTDVDAMGQPRLTFEEARAVVSGQSLEEEGDVPSLARPSK